MRRPSIASALAEIRALKLTLARLDPRAGMPVQPPSGASASGLAVVEQRLGRPLPPSYRELLSLHDGVPLFYQGASLLGTRPLARGTYVDLCRFVVETRGENERDLVPFGIDAEAEVVFAWDLAADAPGGELEVVVFMNEIGVRLDGFPTFLEMCIDMLGSDLADLEAALPASRRRNRSGPGFAIHAA